MRASNTSHINWIKMGKYGFTSDKTNKNWVARATDADISIGYLCLYNDFGTLNLKEW